MNRDTNALPTMDDVYDYLIKINQLGTDRPHRRYKTRPRKGGIWINPFTSRRSHEDKIERYASDLQIAINSIYDDQNWDTVKILWQTRWDTKIWTRAPMINLSTSPMATDQDRQSFIERHRI